MSQAQTIVPPPMATSRQMAALTKLAIPLALAQSSTLVMTLIDLVMVGRLGNNAVAAVGLAVFSSRLIMAPVVGLTSSTRGMVARRRGEGSTAPKCLPVHAGLLVAWAFGFPAAILGYLAAPYVFPLICSDPAVTGIGAPLLSILCLGIPAIGMHNVFGGYWTGLEKSKLYLLLVLFLDGLNTLLNYMLIFGHWGAPVLGALGAAVSTTVALYVGAVLNGLILYFGFPDDGFLRARPERALVMRIARLGFPINVAQFFYASGYVVFLWIIGKVGTAELAAANVLVRVTMGLDVLGTSIGMASATLVNRTLGEGQIEAATRWGWSAAKLGVLTITAAGAVLLFFPRIFLSLFITDPHTMSIAIVPLQVEAATSGAFSLLFVLGYTLNSLGEAKRIMMITLATQWLFFLPLAWLIGPYLHYGLLQLWIGQAAYCLLASVLVTALWMDGRWKIIKI